MKTLPQSFWTTKQQIDTKPASVPCELDSKPAALEAIEQYKTLRFERYLSGNNYAVKVFKGKQGKPRHDAAFPGLEGREAFIATQKHYEDTQDRDRQRFEQEKIDFNASLSAGDILVDSWGYDQTNVNFFLILKRTSETVTIQEVESDKTENGELSMTGKSVPRPDIFYRNSKPQVKKIAALTMRKWNGKPQNYTSYS